MKDPITPIVSIICFAYNHEKYISKTLEGFIIQKIDFPFEIIIHDDASTDRTQKIIKDYENKYPDVPFRNIYQTENQASKERGRVTKLVFSAAKSKYIALCEGDDYWTDPYKIQKQVELLENDFQISGSYSDTNIIWNDGTIESWRTKLPKTMELKDVISHQSPFHTSSFVFRKEQIPMMPAWTADVSSMDMFLFAAIALNGPLVGIEGTPTYYRKHANGITNEFGHRSMSLHLARLILWMNFKQEYNIRLDKIDETIAYHLKNLKNEIIKIESTKKSVTSISDVEIHNFIKRVGRKRLIREFTRSLF